MKFELVLLSRQLSRQQALSQKGPPKCPRRTRAERQLWRQLGNANVATMLRKGQSKRGYTLVGFHAAAASPAPQPMKKLRAGSSHVDPPLRIGQSASPAVQSGTHAAPTTAASGRARPNALAAPQRRPFHRRHAVLSHRFPLRKMFCPHTSYHVHPSNQENATQVLIAHSWPTCC